MDCAALEARYANQFIYGCDSVQCNNTFCARCSDYVLKDPTNSERIAFAKTCSLLASERPPLCSDVWYTVTCSNARSNLKHLESLLRQPTLHQSSDLIEALRNVFCVDMTMGLLFLSNDKQLNVLNSAIDDDEFASLGSLLSSDLAIAEDLLDCLCCAASTLVRSSFSFSRLRALLLLFYFPLSLTPECNHKLLTPIFDKLSSIPFEYKRVAINWLAKLPKLLEMLVGSLHFAISSFFARNPDGSLKSTEVKTLLSVMHMAFTANDVSSSPLPQSAFYDYHIESVVNLEKELEIWKEDNPANSILSKPFVLSLNTKAKICCLECRNLMKTAVMHAIALRGYSQAHPDDRYMTIKISRDNIVGDAFGQLSEMDPMSFLKKLKVVFKGENAVDIGGPSREFLYLLTQKLFAPERGLFKIVNNKFHWFAPVLTEKTRSYFLTGVTVGLAVHNAVVLPVRFPLFLYKRIITPTRRLTLSDLAEIEPDVAKSLRFILQMVENGEDVSELCLSFDVVIDCCGEPKTFTVLENMSGVDVTNENAKLFVESYLQFLLVKLIEPQFEAFKRGFELGAKASSYKLFHPSEMDLIVSGEDVMDWDALKRSTEYKDGYDSHSRAVQWFWDIFTDFSQEKKRKFLKFATGTDRSPFGGLSQVKLVVQRGADPSRLPISHTCFNTFTLPDYASKSAMERLIDYAIEQTEGFGIV